MIEIYRLKLTKKKGGGEKWAKRGPAKANQAEQTGGERGRLRAGIRRATTQS